MAIDKGNSEAIHSLGDYYHYTEKNYDLMKKYYLMAIDKGNDTSVTNILTVMNPFDLYMLTNNKEFVMKYLIDNITKYFWWIKKKIEF